jgi:hypothetical protein
LLKYPIDQAQALWYYLISFVYKTPAPAPHEKPAPTEHPTPALPQGKVEKDQKKPIEKTTIDQKR